MRIDDLNRASQTQSTEKTGEAAQKRALEQKTAISGGADQAEISQLAHGLAAKEPQRLEQLRLAVESGKYDVSAETVAKAIITEHLKP